MGGKVYRYLVFWVVLAGGLLLGSALLGQAPPGPLPSVADLISRLDNPETSDQAADDLGELGTKAVPELLAALETGSEERRELLVAILGRIGDPVARPALERCLTDGSPRIRRAAALALGRLGQRDAAKALVTALGDPDGEVRAYAALALGELRERAALPALVRVLGDDVEQVRDYATVSLGNLQDPQAAPALLWLLTQDPSPYVRAHAANSLGDLGAFGACGRLLDALDDQSDLVRLRAYRALVSLSGKNFPFNARTSGLVRREQVARWREWYDSVRTSLAEMQPVSPKELAQKLTPPAPPAPAPPAAAPTPPTSAPASVAPQLPQPAPAPETPGPGAPPQASTQAPAQTSAGAGGLAPETPPPPATGEPFPADVALRAALAESARLPSPKARTPLASYDALVEPRPSADGRPGGAPSPPPRPPLGGHPVSAGAQRAFATGTSALSRGDWAGARLALGQAVAEAPQWADAHYNLAVAQVKLNDWPEATKALRQATALDPSAGDAWALLGAVLWTTGQLSEAYEALERAASLPGASATTLVNIAGLTLELGEYETSAEWFAALEQRGFQELPAHIQGEAHLRAAVAFYRAGALARSLSHLESAQGLGVRSPWLQVYLGHVLAASGASEQAIDHYRQALLAGIRDAETLRNLADGLLARGGQSEAEAVLKDLLRSDPADGESWLRLGLCLVRQQRWGLRPFGGLRPPLLPEAREALGHALKQGLDDEQVRLALSRVALLQADVQAVVKAFETLLQEHPDDPEAHYYLGLALAQSGQNKGGEGHLRAAGELASSEARYRAALANLLVETGRTGEALSLAEAVAREAPRVARYQALLAEVYFRGGRPGEALQAIDRAILLEPENRAYGEKRLRYLGGATESEGPKAPERSETSSGRPPAPETRGVRSPTPPTGPKAPAQSPGVQ